MSCLVLRLQLMNANTLIIYEQQLLVIQKKNSIGNQTYRSLFTATSVLRISFVHKVRMKVKIYQKIILVSVIITLANSGKVRDRFDWQYIESHVVRTVVPMVNSYSN